MKKIFLPIVVSLLLAGCDDDMVRSKADLTLLVSFVPYYEDNEPFNITPSGLGLLQGWFGDMNAQMPVNRIYSAPEVGGRGEKAERFLEIAERNGDRSYNRYEDWIKYSGRSCCADNYQAVHARCLNAAWDDAHPVGSSLDDILEIEYGSYAEYVRAGYPDNLPSGKTYRKKLSELKKDDMSMIDPYFYFYSDPVPPAGTYEMEVTLVTTEGEEKTATCTLAIE